MPFATPNPDDLITTEQTDALNTILAAFCRRNPGLGEHEIIKYLAQTLLPYLGFDGLLERLVRGEMMPVIRIDVRSGRGGSAALVRPPGTTLH